MVWAKLDDEMLDNPKVARAGVLGFAVHVAGIIHCCRNLTDGYIPQARVACLLDLSAVNMSVHDASPDPELPAVDALGVADWLVECGLWESAPGGYRIHDFLDFNPSREKVLAERQRGADRAKASHEARKASKASPDLRPKTQRRLAEASPDLLPAFVSPSVGPDPVPRDPREGIACAGEDRRFDVGTASAQVALERFSAAVSSATKKPFRLSRAPHHTANLCDALNEYAPKGPKDQTWPWLDAVVVAWIEATDARFAGGWVPEKFLGWLNADKPEKRPISQIRGRADTRQPMREPNPEWLQRVANGDNDL